MRCRVEYSFLSLQKYCWLPALLVYFLKANVHAVQQYLHVIEARSSRQCCRNLMSLQAFVWHFIFYVMLLEKLAFILTSPLVSQFLFSIWYWNIVKCAYAFWWCRQLICFHTNGNHLSYFAVLNIPDDIVYSIFCQLVWVIIATTVF